MTNLFPRDFLKVIAIWSLIPSYSVAGGAIGYGLDRWFHTFPYLTGVGLIIAFGLAVRDMMRLREVFK
jgi:F0F1-type ATP synthase assembly protein I